MASPKICFVLAPIGSPDSDIRKRSDKVFEYIIRPAVEPRGYEPLRADRINKTGLITNQVMDHVLRDDLVIADLTGSNPNVFYEVAIRHAVKKPCILMMEKGERLPFDLAPMRTVFFDHRDLESAEQAKKDIGEMVDEIDRGPWLEDTPVSVALDLLLLKQLPGLERTGPTVRSIPDGTIPDGPALAVGGVELIPNLRGTPFGLASLIEDAEEELLLAAQNHFFVVSHAQDFRNALFAFLRGDERRRASILMCRNDGAHPRSEHDLTRCALEVWKYVTAERYEDDLIEAVRCFQEWQAAADDDTTISGRLQIKAAPHVPLSVNFVDPGLARGYMVVVPNCYEPRNRSRPAFVVTCAKWREAVDGYYASYMHIFDSGGMTKGVLELPRVQPPVQYGPMDLLAGHWELSYQLPGMSPADEDVLINTENEYYADGALKFILEGLAYDQPRRELRLTKANLDGTIFQSEHLRVLSRDLLDGHEEGDPRHRLVYKRAASQRTP